MSIKILGMFAAVALMASSANATVINLSAGPTNPNAGPASYQGYATPNYITQLLTPGTYQLSVVGIAGGGLYDGFSINTSNMSFSDGFHYQIDGSGIDLKYVTGSNYSTAAAALAAYTAMAPAVLTVTTNTLYDFYLNDGASPYFADDSGGVSIGLTAVPEPASLAVLGLGLLGLFLVRSKTTEAGQRAPLVAAA